MLQIGGLTYSIAKFLDNKLKPLVGEIESFVKDLSSFFNELKGIRLDLGDNMVSFDVVSLYTNIPINESIEIIIHITNADTAYLVEISLTSTFFRFEGEFYE